MEPGDAINIIIILVLLLLSAFFSSAETALTTVSKLKMRALAEDKNKAAARVLKLFEEQSKMLSCILICNNVVNLSASSISTTFAFTVCRNNSKDGRNNKCRKAGTFIQPHNPAIDKVTNANYFYHRQNHGFHIISHAG